MPVEACWKRRAVDDFWVRRSSTVRYTSLDACMIGESARENGGLRSTKGIAQTSKQDQLLQPPHILFSYQYQCFPTDIPSLSTITELIQFRCLRDAFCAS